MSTTVIRACAGAGQQETSTASAAIVNRPSSGPYSVCSPLPETFRNAVVPANGCKTYAPLASVTVETPPKLTFVSGEGAPDASDTTPDRVTKPAAVNAMVASVGSAVMSGATDAVTVG